jgi:hypothetical protein
MKIPLSKDNFRSGLSRIRAQWRHAFAVGGAGELSADDVRVLDALAEEVVRRGLASPVLLSLESLGPMNFLGSQALHALQPFLEMVLPAADIERVARLLERRDVPARLADRIEARVKPAGAQ